APVPESLAYLPCKLAPSDRHVCPTRRSSELIVTADHGNAEQMVDPEAGEAHTAHTSNLVPVWLFNAPEGWGLKSGILADLAPSILDLMGIAQPPEMTGQSLIVRRNEQ